MISYKIFLVDDEESIRHGVSLGLKQLYKIKTFPDAESALRRLEIEKPDLVLLDIMLPGISGTHALQKAIYQNSEILVIMISAVEDISIVLDTMRNGAYDYIVKPIHMDSLRVAIKKALHTIKMRKEIQDLQSGYLKENLPFFIGKSNQIQDVMQTVDLVSKSPVTPVLILGESGTGKELIAKTIHFKSPNFAGELVTLNCAAIPENLLESELFGYESGAFSGSRKSGKKGLVETAEGGTLFLDEIGDLSLDAQAKLLRFLEAGEYYRVGSTKKRSVQTRIIAATNKNLLELIETKEFREDLYYRLAVITLMVPSLSKRQADILPIAKHFLMFFDKSYNKNHTGISKEAEAYLLNRNWKGNIRELKNLIEHGVLVGSGPELSINDISPNVKFNRKYQKNITKDFPELPDSGIDLLKLEEHFISQALERTSGNEMQAAKLLNMTYYAFRYRKKKMRNNKMVK